MRRDGQIVKDVTPVKAEEPAKQEPVVEKKEEKVVVEEKKVEEKSSDPTSGMSPEELEKYFKEHPIEVVEEKKEEKKVEEKVEEKKEAAPIVKTELELEREKNAALLKQIEELANKKSEVPNAEVQKPAEEKKVVVATSPELTDEEYAAMWTDKAAFIKGIQKLGITGAVKDAQDAGADPQEIADIIDMKILAIRFFDENKDLAEIKGYTSMVAGELSRKDPKMSAPDVLKETAKVVRERLHLPMPEIIEGEKAKAAVQKKDDPAFAPVQTGASQIKETKPKLMGEQREIHDLLKFAETR
jgi:chemotaxis protein histidine kinase CheA